MCSSDLVHRLVRDAQEAGLVPDGEPAFYTAGILGAVSSFSHAHRRGHIRMPIDDLARMVGDWVTQALTARAQPPSPPGGPSR